MAFPKFKIVKGIDDQFYFHLYAANNRNILDSEAYTSKQACENGIHSVKQNSQDKNNYEQKNANNGAFYFVLKAQNGEIIGKSEMYTTTQARDDGIDSVKNNASSATVEDDS